MQLNCQHLAQKQDRRSKTDLAMILVVFGLFAIRACYQMQWRHFAVPL